jgi:hypothetical protein
MSTPPVPPAPLPPDALILANGSIPAVAFEERAAAAADAAFDAIGLSVWEYDRLRAEGYDDNRFRTALDRHSMRVAELEVVLGFAATGPDRLRQPLPGLDYTDRDTEARFFEMATLFGARISRRSARSTPSSWKTKPSTRSPLSVTEPRHTSCSSRSSSYPAPTSPTRERQPKSSPQLGAPMVACASTAGTTSAATTTTGCSGPSRLRRSS